MSDELRERVARVNCAGDQWDKPCKVPCVDCLREADAAIALVRAEQANRIEQLEAALREAGCDHCRHWFDRAALEERT